ncbi:hypothetical protein Bbelb_019490 [Branchiostoma belcheri]|nr:hypothetical protein Bbelb_019490 [Branchiostoma belcheri]
MCDDSGDQATGGTTPFLFSLFPEIKSANHGKLHIDSPGVYTMEDLQTLGNNETLLAEVRALQDQLSCHDTVMLGFTSVNYEKAFDSVDRNTLWNILSHYGIPPKIINMIKVFYSNVQAQVSHEGDLTEPFNMTTRVRQGRLLRPLLFITALGWIMRETTEREEPRYNGRY